MLADTMVAGILQSDDSEWVRWIASEARLRNFYPCPVRDKVMFLESLEQIKSDFRTFCHDKHLLRVIESDSGEFYASGKTFGTGAVLDLSYGKRRVVLLFRHNVWKWSKELREKYGPREQCVFCDGRLARNTYCKCPRFESLRLNCTEMTNDLFF